RLVTCLVAVLAAAGCSTATVAQGAPPPSTTPPTTAVPPVAADAPHADPPPVLGPDGRVLPAEVGPLREGAAGARTIEVERALDRLGFAPGPVDGTFDAATTSAVWAFQALDGRPKDGTVTADLELRILTAPPPAMLRPDLGPTHTEVDLT